MPQSNINFRTLRKRKQLTQEALGNLIGLTKFQVSRIENGETSLTVDVALRAAQALGVTIEELVGAGPAVGFAEDLTPYVVTTGDKFAAALTADNIYLFNVNTSAIDRAGYPKGMIVQISDHRDACAAVKPLQAVRVLYHPPKSEHVAVSLLRLFVPPRLLITNSSTANRPNIDMDTEDAHIVGVVIGGYQKFTS